MSQVRKSEQVQSVTLSGSTYATPFINLFRQHTSEERAALKKAGEENGGWVSPAITYDSENYGPAVIDGHTRISLSNETGLPVAHMHLGALSDTDAERMALALNYARRHLSAKEQAEARQHRVKRIVEHRAAGKSLRAIAAEEGVDVATVHKDLKSAPVDPSTPAPDTVKGQDGKTYPVKQMLRDLRKTIHPSANRTSTRQDATDEAPATFPRSHPHADLGARLDGLIRSFQAHDGLAVAVDLLRQARRILHEDGTP